MICKSEYEIRCEEKFIARWKRQLGMNLYPFGYDTPLAKLHDSINRRGGLEKTIEAVKDMVWQCNGLPKGKTCAWLNGCTLYELELVYTKRKNELRQNQVDDTI